ncbi:hypothetical protein [Chthonobacter rhizosphaerae]|uniref:hypothetical protein n=1 Tax=Chthonobacter rhizosphaerae TaxID=2735553 RepID=UPI0015EE49FD|nr:hypothetical protein [Chthonobacter rhizosphaerae]
MSDDTLTDAEWTTLTAIASEAELVHDGAVLDSLVRSGLVEQVDGEWRATPAGLAVLQARV